MPLGRIFVLKLASMREMMDVVFDFTDSDAEKLAVGVRGWYEGRFS